MKIKALACMAAALPCCASVYAQNAASSATGQEPVVSMDAITVEASADASAGGLAAPFAGGQVARGGRIGVLGTQDIMDTPFSITSYTNELIQDRQARSVGDVLQNDAGVRVARGFGNFQESYFIRGFILGSDDVAYNGLYSLLPRQYIATEPKPDSRTGMTRMARICVNRSAARCEATPIMSLLLMRVRLTVTELDST